MNIVDELGSYHQEISDEQKKKVLLPTLHKSFKPIDMVCHITQMSFNEVVNAMNVEIELKITFLIHQIHQQLSQHTKHSRRHISSTQYQTIEA